MRGFQMVNAPDGTFVGNVFQNRNGSATAVSVHPSPSGGEYRHIATSMAAGVAWLLAVHDEHLRATPVPRALLA